MAVAQWQPENAQNYFQYEQQQPFDFELLCKKLEAAKRERDAREASAQLRQQQRESVRKHGLEARNDGKGSRSKRTSMIECSETTSWYKLPNKSLKQPSSSGKWADDVKQPYSTVDVEIPEHEPVDLILPAQDQDETTYVLLSRSPSVDDADAIEQRCKKEKFKRRSFMGLKDLLVGDKQNSRGIANDGKTRPNEAAKRRTQTLPLLKTKFTPIKQPFATTIERTDSPEHIEAIQKDSAPLTGFENEYTISFDTGHFKDEQQHRGDGPERKRPSLLGRPSWASGNGMRSLLNLPLAPKNDKKDKTTVGLDEIRNQTMDAEPPPVVRRPHTRSHTAPENLISEAVAKLKNEEKVKKRRRLSGFLETMLGGGHEMSHHACAI